MTDQDEKHLRRALQLAARGRGGVEPNPMVGCVIAKGAQIIGEGYHRRFGGPHAEIEALRRCCQSPRGATVYVTLEPCCHYGKTPPCTDALIQARVSRVVAALKDPNPLVAGRGLAALRRAGVRVDVGLLARQAAELNAPYLKLVREGRPWVILKWAQSLDGKIATRTGQSRWISDPACRKHAHQVRGRVDAILVGVSTIRRDDPLLTCRFGRPKRLATRVVLDTRLRTPITSRLVRTARRIPTWVFCGWGAPAARARELERAGCVVHPVRVARARVPARDPQVPARVSLLAMLDVLGRHQMTNVLVEGGATLLGSFFDQRLADEFHIYLSPILIGGRSAPGPLGGQGVARLARALRLGPLLRWRRVGAGYFVQARMRAPIYA